MAYLSLTDVSKSYNLHTVLNHVSLVLNPGERVGLVGPNGVGKSTLIKIIAGQIAPDSGTVSVPPPIELGYLPQVITSYDEQTLGDLIAQSSRRLSGLEQEMRDLEAHMAVLTHEALTDAMTRYGEVSEQFERLGGYEREHQVAAVLAGLHVDHLPPERRFSTLSGGEKARAGLALLLLGAPDVLLLDEPTNHLDIHALEWLESYLAAYRGAILVVSHDRQFLNRIVTAIVEIDEHTRQAKRYQGDYDSYAQAKLGERRKWEADYARQEEEIRELQLAAKETARNNANYRAHTDNDKFIRNAKIAQHDHTVSKRVQGAEEKLRRLLADPVPQPPAPLRFDPRFDPEALKGHLPIVVSRLTRCFGERRVLDEVSFTVGQHSRIVLTGPNGAGKSTLIKLLAGLDTPDSGEVMLNPAVKIGYLDQEEVQPHPPAPSPNTGRERGTSPPDPLSVYREGEQGRFSREEHQRQLKILTLFETFADGLDGYPPQALKTMLIRSGLFRYEDFEKPVSGLSSGQRRKLQIARLIFGRANLLLLDEPTNDLSFDVLEALEAALHEFPGPVIAASHDRRFIRQFGGEVWLVEGGRIVKS